MIYATTDPAANGRVRELAQFVARDFVSISLVYRRTTAAPCFLLDRLHPLKSLPKNLLHTSEERQMKDNITPRDRPAPPSC